MCNRRFIHMRPCIWWSTTEVPMVLFIISTSSSCQSQGFALMLLTIRFYRDASTTPLHQSRFRWYSPCSFARHRGTCWRYHRHIPIASKSSKASGESMLAFIVKMFRVPLLRRRWWTAHHGRWWSRPRSISAVPTWEHQDPWGEKGPGYLSQQRMRLTNLNIQMISRLYIDLI